MGETYTTFIRSAKNFEEYSAAKKIIQETGLSLADARRECEQWNKDRTLHEIEMGTKMEFEEE